MERPAPTREPSPAQRFSREIAAAMTGGADADGLTLQLTLMDASKLKRDPDLPLDHIAFTPEGMRFLGVRVVEGGVRTSALVTAAAAAADAEAAAPSPPPKRAPKPRKAKAVA